MYKYKESGNGQIGFETVRQHLERPPNKAGDNSIETDRLITTDDDESEEIEATVRHSDTGGQIKDIEGKEDSSMVPVLNVSGKVMYIKEGETLTHTEPMDNG